MITIMAVVDNEKDKQRIFNTPTLIEPYITVIDETDPHMAKQAYALKGYYGARKSPFITIDKDFHLYKMIYAEVAADPIQELIDILNDENLVNS